MSKKILFAIFLVGVSAPLGARAAQDPWAAMHARIQSRMESVDKKLKPSYALNNVPIGAGVSAMIYFPVAGFISKDGFKWNQAFQGAGLGLLHGAVGGYVGTRVDEASGKGARGAGLGTLAGAASAGAAQALWSGLESVAGDFKFLYRIKSGKNLSDSSFWVYSVKEAARKAKLGFLVGALPQLVTVSITLGLDRSLHSSSRKEKP